MIQPNRRLEKTLICFLLINVILWLYILNPTYAAVRINSPYEGVILGPYPLIIARCDKKQCYDSFLVGYNKKDYLFVKELEPHPIDVLARDNLPVDPLTPEFQIRLISESDVIGVTTGQTLRLLYTIRNDSQSPRQFEIIPEMKIFEKIPGQKIMSREDAPLHFQLNPGEYYSFYYNWHIPESIPFKFNGFLEMKNGTEGMKLEGPTVNSFFLADEQQIKRQGDINELRAGLTNEKLETGDIKLIQIDSGGLVSFISSFDYYKGKTYDNIKTEFKQQARQELVNSILRTVFSWAYNLNLLIALLAIAIQWKINNLRRFNRCSTFWFAIPMAMQLWVVFFSSYILYRHFAYPITGCDPDHPASPLIPQVFLYCIPPLFLIAWSWTKTLFNWYK